MNGLWKSVSALVAGAGLVTGCGTGQARGDEVHTPLVSATQGAALESIGVGDTVTLTADDQYDLYINGASIGGNADWPTAKTHSVRVMAKDVIAVKVSNPGGGPAGLLADIQVEGRLALSTDRLAWKCTNVYTPNWHLKDFPDEASWPAAVEHGANGVSPWGPISGISAGAKWIGTSNLTEPTFYCRATVTGCGPDEARLKTPSSSGWWGSNTPDKAFDGDLTTGWQSDMSTGAWLQVDLGGEKVIGRAAITWGWDSRYGTSATAVLEGRTDDGGWETLQTLSHSVEDNGTRQVFPLFPRASVRYVRFRATGLNGGWGYVNDLQLYYPCNQCGEDQAYRRPSSSTGSWGTHTPNKAFDGDPSTGWESSGSTSTSTEGPWVQADFGQDINIASAEVIWGWDSNFGGSASSVLEYKQDGVGQEWKPLGTLVHTAADNFQKQSLSFSAGARYVRLRGTQWNGGRGTVRDLQVIGNCETCVNNLVLNKPVTASSSWYPYAPSYAVDGSTSTRWGTGMSTGAWLQVDMGLDPTGLPHRVGFATLQWAWDPGYGTSADTLLEGSEDGVGWKPLGSFTHTQATNRRQQSLYFPAEKARYVRLSATRWNGGWGDVTELKVCPMK